MIVLDENFDRFQQDRLRRWRIRTRRIGVEFARKGTLDPALIPLLHRLTRPTFITSDRQFYDRRLRHESYCLVVLDVRIPDQAHFTRRFLRHPAFRTHAQRQGAVVRVGYEAVHVWRLVAEREEEVAWTDAE